MMMYIKPITAKIIAIASCSLFTACVNQEPASKPVHRPIYSNPLYVDEIPIGVALIRLHTRQQASIRNTLTASNSRPAIALSVRSDENYWVAIGPSRMVSIGNIYEQNVLQAACGGYEARFLQNHGRFRVHECIGRPVKHSDIDVIGKYNLPAQFHY